MSRCFDWRNVVEIFDNMAYIYLASHSPQKKEAVHEAFSAAGWTPSVMCCYARSFAPGQPHGREQTELGARNRLFDAIRRMRRMPHKPDPYVRNVFVCSVENGLIEGTGEDGLEPGWMYDYAEVCVHRCGTRVAFCVDSEPVPCDEIQSRSAAVIAHAIYRLLYWQNYCNNDFRFISSA